MIDANSCVHCLTQKQLFFNNLVLILIDIGLIWLNLHIKFKNKTRPLPKVNRDWDYWYEMLGLALWFPACIELLVIPVSVMSLDPHALKLNGGWWYLGAPVFMFMLGAGLVFEGAGRRSDVVRAQIERAEKALKEIKTTYPPSEQTLAHLAMLGYKNIVDYIKQLEKMAKP